MWWYTDGYQKDHIPCDKELAITQQSNNNLLAILGTKRYLHGAKNWYLRPNIEAFFKSCIMSYKTTLIHFPKYPYRMLNKSDNETKYYE